LRTIHRLTSALLQDLVNRVSIKPAVRLDVEFFHVRDVLHRNRASTATIFLDIPLYREGDASNDVSCGFVVVDTVHLDEPERAIARRAVDVEKHIWVHLVIDLATTLSIRLEDDSLHIKLAVRLDDAIKQQRRVSLWVRLFVICVRVCNKSQKIRPHQNGEDM
jgi:hypothetical protein